MAMRSWKVMISLEMKDFKDSWDNVVSSTMTDQESLEEFDTGYGGTNGCSFTVWTKDRVYFPVCYDGAEWVGSVSRNPNSIATDHQGGG